MGLRDRGVLRVRNTKRAVGDGESIEVLVEPWKGLTPSDTESVLKKFLSRIDRVGELQRYLWIRVPYGTLEDLDGSGELLRERGIRYIWPNNHLSTQYTAAPIITHLREPLRTIDHDPKDSDGEGITWAIIDSDVRNTHETFSDSRIERYTVTDEHVLSAGDFDAQCSHGTHVAGILRGVAPAVRIIVLALDADPQPGDQPCRVASVAHLERALEWLKDREDIHGINISLGIEPEDQDPLVGQTVGCLTLNDCVDQGKFVVVAAGNYGQRRGSFDDGRFMEVSITDPANARRAYVVGACATDDPKTNGIWSRSSHGPTADGRTKPDLVAPGIEITSATHTGDQDYAAMSGSSMAAPFVSGALAALMSRTGRKNEKPSFWADVLRNSAQTLDRLPTYQGSGLLQVKKALAYA